MSIGTDRYNSVHGYISWQYPVQFILHPRTVLRLVQVKMRNHLGCMHAGIGTTGSGHTHALSQEKSQALLQCLLDRWRMRLYLPSAIGGSVKLKIDEVPHSLICDARFIICTATSAAVSVLRRDGPNDTGLKPAFFAAAISAGLKSPSGPIRTVQSCPETTAS